MHISSRSLRALGLLAGCSTFAVATPAFAQNAEENAGLDEIVVTAQKREQNLQEVPLAISAISAEKVEKLGISDSRDLSGLAPNVTIVQGTTSNSSAVISMRGISNGGSETFGLDMASGIYVDGVYIGRSGAAGLEVADIERIEVLRGPQGTLFGRNTTGGAIHFISRAPSKDLRIKGELGYGNYEAWNGKISIDPGEIMGGITTSFSYAHRQRNGTVDNILQPDKSRDPGSRKSDSFRGALRFELGGTGSFQYIFDWTKTSGSPNAFQLTNVANGTPNSLSVGGVPLTVTQQAPVQQYLAGATFAQAACRALSAPTRVYRSEICNDISGYATDKIWGHNVQVQNDFEVFKVKLTSGYRKWDSTSVSDLDGMGSFTGPAFTNATLFNGFPSALLQNLGFPAATSNFLAGSAVPTVTQNLFDTNNHREHTQFSNELEISGDTDNLDWVVGGFYFWEKGSENNPQNSGFVLDTNAAVFSNTAFVGVLRGVGFPQASAEAFAPLLAPSFRATNPAALRLVQTRSILKYTAQAESTALYGQFTFFPGGRDSGIRLTAGGRYTWDSKKISRSQNGAAALVTPQTGNASYSKFTWNAMLGYDIADGISTYARVATGYRSGGFNAGDPADASNIIPSFNSETVTSYEVGLKTELFDRRLRFNIAGYHNVYNDLAVIIPIPNATAGTFTTRVGNAGKVHYTGFEAEFQAKLNNNFSIDGSIGYVDVKYKEFCTGQPTSTTVAGSPGCPTGVINIASIVTPGYTSPWTANVAANARFPLGSGDTQIAARVAFTYEDGKYSFNNNIGAPFNNQLKGDNRNLIDAQIAIENIEVGGAKVDLKFWGKNLTDSHDFVRGVDFGALGYAGGFYADPRTFGATIGFKF